MLVQFNEIFSGRQPLQNVKVFRFGNKLLSNKPPAQPENVDGVISRNVSENLRILTRLSDQANFTGFYRRESFKTCKCI
jgi:hypothetical protein